MSTVSQNYVGTLVQKIARRNIEHVSNFYAPKMVRLRNIVSLCHNIGTVWCSQNDTYFAGGALET